MSYKLIGEEVLFYQRLMASDGYYHGRLDGKWGSNTGDAFEKYEDDSLRLRKIFGQFDIRTENNILSLSIRAQKEARLFMKRALRKELIVKIISGTRTYEEQNKLFRQGRYGNPGKIVTKARGGRSKHNFGIAWDVGIFNEKGSYSTNYKEYVKLSGYAKQNLNWGGDWISFPDPPHYQLPTIDTKTSWVRNKFENGEKFVV